MKRGWDYYIGIAKIWRALHIQAMVRRYVDKAIAAMDAEIASRYN